MADPNHFTWPPSRSDFVFAAALVVLGFALAKELWGLVAVSLGVLLVAALLPRMRGPFTLKAPGTTVQGDIQGPTAGADEDVKQVPVGGESSGVLEERPTETPPE